MATGWRTRSTYVEIDLGEVDNECLLQQLINCGWISETEAFAIVARHAAKEKARPILAEPASIQVEELTEAKYWLGRGNREEALIHLERFLGRDFAGRLLS